MTATGTRRNTALGFLAAHTERVRLGTMVSGVTSSPRRRTTKCSGTEARPATTAAERSAVPEGPLRPGYGHDIYVRRGCLTTRVRLYAEAKGNVTHDTGCGHINDLQEGDVR